MINTQKVVALAFSYHDSLVDPQTLTKEQKEHAIR
jgi:hypothetical protein